MTDDQILHYTFTIQTEPNPIIAQEPTYKQKVGEILHLIVETNNRV